MESKTALDVAPKMQKKIKLVPPDGGWGWMVILGTAMCNLFNQSMLSLFGLLYGDALEAMGHQTEGAAIVMSTMLFVTNFGGPVAGVLLKFTSARFVSVLGACLCTTGIFLSGFATNIIHLILTYGVLLGCGLGFVQNATFVAINSYFKIRKGQAVGLAQVGTGVGQTLMPHLVRYLLDKFSFQGTCLILSGLSLNGIAGTMLVQPVDRHLKKVEVEEEIEEEKQVLIENKHKDIVINRKDSNAEHCNGARKLSETASLKDINGVKTYHSHKNLSEKSITEVNGSNDVKNGDVDKSSKEKKGFLSKLYVLFDISLLTSARFVNIIIGTALAVTSIQNFSLIFPIFLQKVASMDKQQTANCMSAVAIADIMGRIVLPYFQDKYKIKARCMLMVTALWLIVTRQIIAYQTNLMTLLMMSAMYGFWRSVVIVSRNIAISENCRIEQVPAAVGLNMLSMGIMVPPVGYFLGWIRDYTGSYIVCISAQNLLLVILIVTWLPDMTCQWIQERKQSKKIEPEEIRLS